MGLDEWTVGAGAGEKLEHVLSEKWRGVSEHVLSKGGGIDQGDGGVEIEGESGEEGGREMGDLNSKLDSVFGEEGWLIIIENYVRIWEFNIWRIFEQNILFKESWLLNSRDCDDWKWSQDARTPITWGSKF